MNALDTVTAVAARPEAKAADVEASAPNKSNSKASKGLNSDLRMVRRRRYEATAGARDDESSQTLQRVASQISKGMQTSSQCVTKNLNLIPVEQGSRGGNESGLSTKEASRPQPPSSSVLNRASDARSILLMKSQQCKRRAANALHQSCRQQRTDSALRWNSDLVQQTDMGS